MKLASGYSFIDKISFKLLFFLLFVYQVLFIFQGVNVADEGFHATFYKLIFKEPESVQYNFMFWFSGIVGGSFHYLMADLGLWGIRLAGVIVITATSIISYALLKNYIKPNHLKIGLVLATILINNNHKTLYYDNLSALFYSIIAYFLFKGIEKDNKWKLILAGLFVSLNAFTRLPNLLGLGLAVVIVLAGILNKKSSKYQLTQVFFFFSGFAMTTILVLVFMKAIGHLTYFSNAIALVFKMGSQTKGSNYSLPAMIKGHFVLYIRGFIYSLILLFLLIIPDFLKNLLAKNKRLSEDIFVVSKILIWVLLLVIVVRDVDKNELTLLFFSGFTIISGILIFYSRAAISIKLLMAIALFIFFVYPFGSYLGLLSVGIYTFWLAAPLVIHCLANVKKIQNVFTIGQLTSGFSLVFNVEGYQLKQIKMVIVVLFAALCLEHAYFYPFFDKRNRITQHYAINNEHLRGIYTTRDRAQAINEFLEECKKYVKPGDYVLAYDCMPLFHYLTDTKPYMRNSWPYLYLPSVFKEELNRPLENGNTKLPVVVWQTIRPIGKGADWPTHPVVPDLEWAERNKDRNEALITFLEKNKYKKVWSNTIFDIYIPPGQ
ncbi:MAG: glycosyltransferase family 39 protein [Chitinophagaceae bacterium]|nr:glycosyltransferase family 39 protein [Chitinophagaceae bacterium]